MINVKRFHDNDNSVDLESSNNDFKRIKHNVTFDEINDWVSYGGEYDNQIQLCSKYVINRINLCKRL